MSAQNEDEGRTGNVKVLANVRREVVLSGPLPVASEFRRYEEALPGAGDRILKMAEKERSARNIKDYLRIGAALIFALAALAVVVYGFSQGYSWEGTSLGLVIFITIIGREIAKFFRSD